jgi:nitrate/TMAO reductase-like tetraheme cytochrome c subunit
MRKIVLLSFVLIAGGLGIVLAARPGEKAPADFSAKTLRCIECHKESNPGIYQQWGQSKHYRAHVGCYECHAAEANAPGAFAHYGATVAILVTPKDCGQCHSREANEFLESRHAKAGRILGSLDNTLAEVVEGSRGMKTAGFPQGVSAAAVNGCWECHGSQVKVLEKGRLDPATFPNSGIGRLNPDGTEGACNACHSRHTFSAEQARFPDTCGKCHMGPDHPQMEIYNESKHGIAFRANLDKMNLGNAKWVAGEDYHAAPTCSTCHMSATRTQPVSHSIGLRISWNNRPARSIRPEESDKQMGLPSGAVYWKQRRANMKDVCMSCHQADWADNFFTQYDALIELYDTKFAAPGLKLYDLARKLTPRTTQFANPIDFTWYEIWHHEGRRARHGASMMGPDYTHWHGTYEVAKNFYSKFVPELQELIDAGHKSEDALKKKAAEELAAELEKVLSQQDHQWFLDKIDPAEKARRAKAIEEFNKRYEKPAP